MHSPASFRSQITIVLAASSILGTCISSQAQDLPPPSNIATILKELDEIASGARSNVQNRRSSAIAQIQSACGSSASAVEFVLTALSKTKYSDSPQDFFDWRHKNLNVFVHQSYQNAALLQLRYLLMALQRSEQHDAYTQTAECLDYLNTFSAQNFLQGDSEGSPKKNQKQREIISHDKVIPEAKQLLEQSLADTPVVEWLHLRDLLPDGKDFEFTPGNYGAILETNIRVSLRQKKDPRLPGTWDTQMAAESAAATASHSQQQIDTFNQTRLPELLFKKAQDTASIGQPNRALDEIIQLIRTYPANPSVKDWIESARGILGNSIPPSPAASPTISKAPALPPTPPAHP